MGHKVERKEIKLVSTLCSLGAFLNPNVQYPSLCPASSTVKQRTDSVGGLADGSGV